jgi:hypothetical protein
VSIKTLLAVGAIAFGTTATFTLTTGTAVAVPYTTSATVGVSNSNPDAGTAITVTLTGFQANEAVGGDLLSRKIHVFDVTADGAGSATAAFTIPAHFECGDHVILARGAQGDTAFADITVGGDCTPVGERRGRGRGPGGGNCEGNCDGGHGHACEGNCTGGHWEECDGNCDHDWDGFGVRGRGDLDLDLAGFGLVGAAASLLLVRRLRRRND